MDRRRRQRQNRLRSFRRQHRRLEAGCDPPRRDSRLNDTDSGIIASRPRFTTRFGIVMTFIGVAVGLGNVWRFPYMV
ncbi:MAG: hypothetical protein IH878_06970, partial [Gemmatimonadetes bacterium]|nr:hypothetical protein [Gemmatimonadota bacterium]